MPGKPGKVERQQDQTLKHGVTKHHTALYTCRLFLSVVMRVDAQGALLCGVSRFARRNHAE